MSPQGCTRRRDFPQGPVDILRGSWQGVGAHLTGFAHEVDVVCRRLLETTAEKVTRMTNAAMTLSRTPLVISAGNLTAGPVQATFREGDRESLLHNYLGLVRRMRGQLREPTITLRNADISELAEHLGASEEIVLDDLLHRMGATRAQRKALLAMFAVGALSIVATGSIALEVSSSGALAEGSFQTPPVVESVQVLETRALTGDAASTAAPEVPVVAEASPTEPVAGSTQPAPQAELPIAVGGADWEYALALHQLAQALSTQPSDLAVAGQGEGVGVADDGSTVAVGQPPIRAADGVGIADDGSTVGVGTPPVPPAEGIGVADDGSVVGVAPPPVP